MALFRRRSVLEQRQRVIERALSDVQGRIRTLKKELNRRGLSSDADLEDLGYRIELALRAPEESGGGAAAARERVAGKPAGRRKKDADGAESPRLRAVRDERFADYLASNLAASRPLRHERQVQRNRAVVMLLVVVIVLTWVVFQFFL